jgi:hypothetical protein
VCIKKYGALIFLRVVLSIDGQFDSDIVSNLQHAFSMTFNINKALFLNTYNVSAFSRLSKIELHIEQEEAQVEALKDEILRSDTQELRLYKGLANLNITIDSVDIVLDITRISQDTDIIRIVVLAAICIASLLCLSVLCKCCCHGSSSAQTPTFANVGLLSCFAGLMGLKFVDSNKKYAAI